MEWSTRCADTVLPRYCTAKVLYCQGTVHQFLRVIVYKPGQRQRLPLPGAAATGAPALRLRNCRRCAAAGRHSLLRRCMHASEQLPSICKCPAAHHLSLPPNTPTHPTHHPAPPSPTPPPTHPTPPKPQALMHGVDEVAVKRIRSPAPSPSDLATFHHEVAVLASLRHRNIVQVCVWGGEGEMVGWMDGWMAARSLASIGGRGGRDALSHWLDSSGVSVARQLSSAPPGSSSRQGPWRSPCPHQLRSLRAPFPTPFLPRPSHRPVLRRQPAAGEPVPGDRSHER